MLIKHWSLSSVLMVMWTYSKVWEVLHAPCILEAFPSELRKLWEPSEVTLDILSVQSDLCEAFGLAHAEPLGLLLLSYLTYPALVVLDWLSYPLPDEEFLASVSGSCECKTRPCCSWWGCWAPWCSWVACLTSYPLGVHSSDSTLTLENRSLHLNILLT